MTFSFTQALLSWYDEHGRSLPWRIPNTEDAWRLPLFYHVLLSEVMLQQTQVKTVIPYFQNFISLWPTLKSLGEAHEEDVLTAWSGLGYYRRAQNLKRAAQQLSTYFDKNGAYPQTASELLTFPGIGDYTSQALIAIAFNQPALPLDGNLKRVFARYFNLHSDSTTKSFDRTVREKAQPLLSQERSSAFAQALMDLGSDICTSTSPACLFCPLQEGCLAYSAGTERLLPFKPKKTKLTPWIQRHFLAITRKNQSTKNEVLLLKQKNMSFNATLLILPRLEPFVYDSSLTRIKSTDSLGLFITGHPRDDMTLSSSPDLEQLSTLSQAAQAKQIEVGTFRHIYSHFKLEACITMIEEQHLSITSPKDDAIELIWVPLEDLDRYPLSSLMTKCLSEVIKRI